MNTEAGGLDLRGGHPVIDFVNTVAWRGDVARRIDHLRDYADLVAWCRHADVVTPDDAAGLMRAMRSDQGEAERALAKAKHLREALHTLWTGGGSSVLSTITKAYSSALGHSELRQVGEVVAWSERLLTMRSPVERLAVDAVALITTTPLTRVKQCDDAVCGWLFLDGSHRQNRRWCSAADCGNRDRARRHYERSRVR